MRLRNRKGKWIELPDDTRTPEEHAEWNGLVVGMRYRMKIFDMNPKEIREKAHEDAYTAALASQYVIQ